MKSRVLLTALSAFLLSSCSVGIDYAPPEQSFLDRWFSQETAETENQGKEIKTDWWTVFGDQQLEQYIHKAVIQNRELEAARANIRRARALRQESSSSFFPSIDSDLGRTRQNTGTTQRTIYDAGFDASWEIDIFGGTRRATEAAQARFEKSIDEGHAVLLSVLAETARNYYDVRGLQKRMAITQKNIDLQEQTYKLVENLFEMGEASEFDLSRAKGQLELTQSRLPDFYAEMNAGVYRLSVLLGLPPEALLEDMKTIQPLPLPPDVVPVGLRSEILRRRPDVRMAERELAAATADIGVAVADLYPRFNLTGSIGRNASVFSDLFDPNSHVFSIGQFLQWPVFQGGAIRANIKVQEAEAQEAAALYEQVVLESLADAETALTRYVQKQKTSRRLQSAVHSRRQAASLARARFNAGEENFLSVLDAERELTGAEDDLVVSETNTILNLVSLYTALGGGWDMFEEQNAALQ